jgi:molybdopterin converting factor small subunit
MRLKIIYFGLLAERRGVAEETIETAATRPDEVYAALDAGHGLGLAPADFRVAVNDTFAAWNHPLADGDTLALLPPMSGG